LIRNLKLGPTVDCRRTSGSWLQPWTLWSR